MTMVIDNEKYEVRFTRRHCVSVLSPRTGDWIHTYDVTPFEKQNGLTTIDTYCDIYVRNLTNQVRVGFGYALQNKLDRYDKGTARRLAFGRAVSDLPKPVRTGLWQEFFADDEERQYN